MTCVCVCVCVCVCLQLMADNQQAPDEAARVKDVQAQYLRCPSPRSVNI